MIIKFSAKCSDMCSYRLFNDAGEEIHETDGECPSGIGIGGGDYVTMKVDLATGQIVGFKPMTDQEVLEALDLVKEEDEDDEDF